MRAWLLNDTKGLESLRLGTAANPEPSDGEAVLRISLAALNPADRYLAEGQYPFKSSLPHILGRDGIGVVTAIGAGVEGIGIGDKRIVLRSDVGVNRPGTLAEFVAVPAESLVPPPHGWSDEQSAGAPLVYLTAWQALTQWGDLAPSVVLVTGASGGVGVATVQIAAALGHTVVALSRSVSKRDNLLKHGAGHVLDPQDPTWAQNLKSALSGRRVDLAIDNIGGRLFNEVLGTLGDRGRVSVVGRLAGPVPEFNTASLFFRRIRIGGVAVGAYTPQQSRDAWNSIIDILHRRDIRPIVDRVFSFEQLSEAFERLHQGPMGKVLLQVAAL